MCSVQSGGLLKSLIRARTLSQSMTWLHYGFYVYFRYMEICESTMTPPGDLHDSFWDSYTQPGVKLMVYTVIQACSAQMSRRHRPEDIRYQFFTKQPILERPKKSADRQKATVNQLSDSVTRLEPELAQVLQRCLGDICRRIYGTCFSQSRLYWSDLRS